MNAEIPLEKLSDLKWTIPKKGRMNVPAFIYASEKLLQKIKMDRTLEQLKNMTCLPGIYKKAITLPDAHQGYGFPIGGVAALSMENGGISPGGIGYDINCGVRLLRTNFTEEEIRPKLKELLELIFKNVPSGVGSEGKIRLSNDELREVLARGAEWAVDNNYGWQKDLKHHEEEGCLKPNNPDFVSDRAMKRGRPQLGSLGAGNHFLEIQKVDKIMNPEVARKFGIEKEGQVCVMIHCGSRGLGHQVCSDYLREMERNFRDLVAKLPDRELVYAPAGSDMASMYFRAMACAANYAWANRQMITHWARESFEKLFSQSAEEMGINLIYDVCHNVCKIEEHDGMKFYLHRKGATRAFPKGSEHIPEDYKGVGQPVILPGSMGTASYLLYGAENALSETFGSTAHGAGRLMSRHKAVQSFRGEKVANIMMQKKILIRARSWKGIAEEAPGAYKDIDEVARVSHELGIARKVARLVPMAVVKG